MSARPLPPNRRVAPRAVAPEIPDESRFEPAPEVETPRAAKVRPKRAPFRLPEGVKRLFRGVRFAMGATLFVGTAAVSSLGLYRYVSTSPRFAVRSVTAVGNAHRSEEQLAKLAGVDRGTNVFSIDLDQAALAIKQDPWIEAATVTRQLPGSLTITVTEREAVAIVAVGSDLYLAAPGGEVFKRVEADDPADLPVITGIPREEGKSVDRALLAALVARAEEVSADYDRAGPNKRFPLQEVHLTEEGGVELFVGKEVVRLALGKPPFRAKIERGARVLAEIERRRGQASTIFLDNDAHPERVVARLTEPPRAPAGGRPR